jgi:hypothetical protein
VARKIVGRWLHAGMAHAWVCWREHVQENQGERIKEEIEGAALNASSVSQVGPRRLYF